MDTTGITFIDDLDLADQTVFIRVDFNVPLAGGEVTDDTRIQAALPTIRHAIEHADKVVLASHLGRPKGKRDDALSMQPVGARLSELLDMDVIVPEELTGEFVQKLIEEMKGDQIMLLENLRFDPGEKAGDADFARGLAELADVYVNDAFGTSHRKHASMYWMVEHFGRGKKAAGFLIRTEIEGLSRVTDKPRRPFAAIMGGAKVSDKIGVLEVLVEKVDRVLIGGAMAYTFLKAGDVQVGDSLVEDDYLEQANEILTKARRLDVDVHLPCDHLVAGDMDANPGEVDTTESEAIPPGKAGFDIGPKTIAAYQKALDGAKTVFWNGPMGVFEREPFAQGTVAVARAVASADGFSVVGGGDSVAALNNTGLSDEIDHISTGGGASLELVEGKPLPGLEALRVNHPFE